MLDRPTPFGVVVSYHYLFDPVLISRLALRNGRTLGGPRQGSPVRPKIFGLLSFLLSNRQFEPFVEAFSFFVCLGKVGASYGNTVEEVSDPGVGSAQGPTRWVECNMA